MSTKKFKHAPLPVPKKKVTTTKKAAKVKVPRPLLTEPKKPTKPQVKQKKITLGSLPNYGELVDSLCKDWIVFAGGKVKDCVDSWGDGYWDLVSPPDKQYVKDETFYTASGLNKLAEYIAMKEKELPGIDGTKKLWARLDYDYLEFEYEAMMYPSVDEIHAQNKRYETALEKYNKDLEAYNHPVSVEARKKQVEKKTKAIQSKMDKLKKAQAELEKKLKKAS